MEVNLLDRMLAEYQDRKAPVTIMLQNRIRISGRIRSFDSYVIVLENQKNEIVYRHAVSSIARQAVAAEHAKIPQRRPEHVQARPAAQRPHKAAAPAVRQKPVQQPSRAAAQPDSAINTGMKEGLLRWMQGQKASK